MKSSCAFNYIADVQAILWCGATPVFCDIEERMLALNPQRVKELISPRTKAIMPLHFAGIVCDIDAISAIAKSHNLRIIEDATHALGSSHRGKLIGSVGDITCFSFVLSKSSLPRWRRVVCNQTEDLAASPPASAQRGQTPPNATATAARGTTT
jgi:dTDP-4-amino-4,6-dideoxygalactose transaminase